MAKSIDSLQLELKKWQFKSKQKKPKLYFVYLIFLLCFAYIIDEIASNINGIMQNEIINQFFGGEYSNQYILITSLCSGAAFFTFFYKVFADKFGRKPFLVINTIGLGIAMFICFLSKSLLFFSFGLVLIAFFIPCDVQVVYVLEISSDKNRGLWAALTKAIAIMGVAIIPPIRNWALSIGWSWAYFIPACLAIICGTLCFFFVKESDVFIKNKISYIKKQIKLAKNPELAEKYSKTEKLKNKQGGVIPAVKYILINKSLIWLFVVGIVLSFTTIATGNYSIMFEQNDKIFTPQMVTNALTVYPFAWAVIEVLIGFLSDRIGRKRSTILSGVITLYGFLCFVIGIKTGWNPYVVGVLLGLFLGGYISCVDMINVISAEESPTNLRSSVLSIINAAFSIGSLCGTGILLLFNKFIPNLDVAYFALIMIVPSLFIGLLILSTKTQETKSFSLLNSLSALLEKLSSRKNKDTDDNDK